MNKQERKAIEVAAKKVLTALNGENNIIGIQALQTVAANIILWNPGTAKAKIDAYDGLIEYLLDGRGQFITAAEDAAELENEEGEQDAH